MERLKMQDLAEDLLDGVPAIARFTGWTKRRVYYLAEQKLIPAFKVGERWCCRKSTLRNHVERLEAKGKAGHV
jgi:excisionase family DNA binding protein